MVEKRNRPGQGEAGAGNGFAYGPCRQPPMPEYANYQSKVRRWSTVQVAGRSYSVPVPAH